MKMVDNVAEMLRFITDKLKKNANSYTVNEIHTIRSEALRLCDACDSITGDSISNCDGGYQHTEQDVTVHVATPSFRQTLEMVGKVKVAEMFFPKK